MAAKSRAAKAQKAAVKARYNPYVQRVIEDDELRDNIVQAYESARNAINRLSNGKSPTKQIFDDRKLQKDLSQAATSLRDASYALREGPRRKKRLGLGKLLLLTIVGAGVAVGVSEGLRKKLLDALFGAEEEFEYTSTTTPPTTTGTSSVGTTGSVSSTPATATTGDPSPASGAGQ